ncbi:MAG: TRAP transporter large permease [Oscillospiraceae bacterium]|nr:TRAP transporter large permease [Oscillospiraceae bacterium]
MTPDPNVAILILIGGLLFLVVLRLPVVFAVGISTTACLLYLGFTPAAVVQQTIRGISSFSLMAVPFFITMGALLAAGGIGDRLVVLAHTMVGWMRGGLAQVNVISSIIFSGISGSAGADVASIGSVIIPQMVKNGYKDDFSGALSMSTALMALVKPPGHNMVIYASAAGGVSVGALFLAGYIPVAIMAVSFIITVYFLSVKRGYPKGERFNIMVLLREMFKSFWAMAVILIVVIGVVAGIFTATESAAIAVIYCLFVGIYVYKGLQWRRVWGVLTEAVNMLSVIMILIGISSAFGFALTFLRVPAIAAELVTAFTDNPIVIFLLINVLLMLISSIMDMAPVILITTPILLPLAMEAGMHPVTFGIMIILNCGIGLITPPVGTVLFICSSVSKVPAERLIKANIPFYLCLLIPLMLITYVPAITLTLPRIFGLVS